MRSKILIIFAVSLMAVSCFLDESYDTQYRLKSYVQEYSGDEFDYYISVEGVLLYAFDGDAESWGANSYEDAVAGVAYNFETGELLTPIAQSVVDESEPNTVVVRLQREYVMLLAVDTVNRIYATRNYTVGLNLPTTSVTLLWRPWKTDSYTEGSWYFDHSSVILTGVVEEEEE